MMPPEMNSEKNDTPDAVSYRDELVRKLRRKICILERERTGRQPGGMERFSVPQSNSVFGCAKKTPYLLAVGALFNSSVLGGVYGYVLPHNDHGSTQGGVESVNAHSRGAASRVSGDDIISSTISLYVKNDVNPFLDKGNVDTFLEKPFCREDHGAENRPGCSVQQSESGSKMRKHLRGVKDLQKSEGVGNIRNDSSKGGGNKEIDNGEGGSNKESDSSEKDSSGTLAGSIKRVVDEHPVDATLAAASSCSAGCLLLRRQAATEFEKAFRLCDGWLGEKANEITLDTEDVNEVLRAFPSMSESHILGNPKGWSVSLKHDTVLRDIRLTLSLTTSSEPGPAAAVGGVRDVVRPSTVDLVINLDAVRDPHGALELRLERKIISDNDRVALKKFMSNPKGIAISKEEMNLLFPFLLPGRDGWTAVTETTQRDDRSYRTLRGPDSSECVVYVSDDTVSLRQNRHEPFGS